jgi:hypothetical protein
MNFAAAIDFNALMEPVAARLAGEPNKRLSKPPREVRFGTHGSLSVNYETGQFFDHEANVGGGVFDFVKYKLGCDHAGAVAWLRGQGLLPSSPEPRRLKVIRDTGAVTYDYLDEDGVLLSQVVRHEPKDFRQRRPDGRDGWIWNLEGVRRVPYHLPDLIAAAGKLVFISEGEKDCDNVRALGFTATTNMGGAGKWLPEYNQFLRGADVVLLPHNDNAGRDHAERVATSLNKTASRIRVLDIAKTWPECPEKGDISDWIEAEGTAERLKTLIGDLSDWEAPSDESPWPVMDSAAYYGLAGDVVETLKPHSESDPVAILIQYLTAFGNIVGNAPYYLVESDRHGANIFAVLVGASSKGRKGTAADRIRAIAKIADEHWSLERTASGLSSGEGLINAVRNPVVKWNAKERIEEVVDPGVLDKRLMVTEPELAGVLAAMERHGNSLSPVIRNAWDGIRLQTLTKASPLKADGAHISIAAHITEAEARARLTRTDMANGFANRFQFFSVRRSQFLPHGGNLSEAELIRLGHRTKEAVEFAKKTGRVTMVAKAAEAWEAAYPEVSAERPGLLGALIARAEAQVIRLALIYALLDQKTQIDVDHLDAAMAVWAYAEESALRIFGDSLGDPIADEILVALRRSNMTRTEIHSLFGRHRSGEQIAAALTLLLKTGRAEFETRHTGGRPVEDWSAIGGRA